MTYSATWQNSDESGRVSSGVHTIALSDAAELAERINRRRLLVCMLQQDYSSHVASGAWVRQSTLASAQYPPLDSLRDNLLTGILKAPAGALGGTPPTPASMEWLWPVSGPDENKVIVPGNDGIGQGQVGLLQKLNGTSAWTDPALTAGECTIRAVHINELRQAVEWLSRGRWRLPVYMPSGIFSPMPDTPWIPNAVANNGNDELRALGYAVVSNDETPPRCLTDVAVRSSTSLTITAGLGCTIEARHCLRDIPWTTALPTWNEYDTAASLAWNAPGGAGQGDSAYLGSVALQAGVPGVISTSSLAAAVQEMVDGGLPYFLFRQTNSSPMTAGIAAELTVEFDLEPDVSD